MRGYHIEIALSDSSVPLPTDIFSDLSAYKPQSGVSRSNSTPPKDYRFGPIRVDWMDLPETLPNLNAAAATKKADLVLDPTTNGKQPMPPRLSTSPLSATFIPSPQAGPPTTPLSFGTANLSEGTIRLFRDIYQHEEEEVGPRMPQDDGTMLSVLAVPSYMTPADFITYVAPAEDGMAHLRLIRDASENRSIALLKFRDRDHAEEFAQEYNGRAFNSIEPETCHVVRITSVSVNVVDNSISRFLQSPSKGLMDVYELPTCPVCLERMDSAVTGLVTVPCSHTFHCMCLSKWGDSRCPVCRYSQALLTSHPRNPNSSLPAPFSSIGAPSLSACSSCSSTTNLWICLICGNVGCGRYGRAHAHQHYTQTTHLYALELETQRVWDYAGDGYVHRLIQNRADGKLVELPSASAMTPSFTSLADPSGPQQNGSSTSGGRMGPGPADALAADKVEAIGIEYSYLLTSQLDSQRAYFEEEKSVLEVAVRDAHERLAQFESRVARLDAEDAASKKLETRAQRAEVRAERAVESTRKLEKELDEEKALSTGLMARITSLNSELQKAEEERSVFGRTLAEMQDQLRDMMIYIEARDKIQNEAIQGSGNGTSSVLGEAVGGAISLPAPSLEPPQTMKRPRRKKG